MYICIYIYKGGEDVINNFAMCKVFAEVEPGKVPSKFLIADVLIEMNLRLNRNMFTGDAQAVLRKASRMHIDTQR